jgi:hypothetical protein
MMKHLIFLLLLFSLPGLAIRPALAEDSINPNRVAFRGFGTVGLSCFSSDNYDFLRYESPSGPGKSRRCDNRLDSLLGLQLDANLTERLQGTLQTTNYHRADNTFKPEVTLANLRVELSDNNTLRIGRIQNPILLVSDYRNVMYSQPWARPPADMYNLVEVFSFDGIELNHRLEINNDVLTLQGGLVRSNFDASRSPVATDPIKVRVAYMNVLSERGDWLLKGSILGGNIYYTNPDIEAALAALDSLGASDLASNLSMKDKHVLLIGLGTRYETNQWLVQGEYLYRTIDSFYRDQHDAYLMAGRHFGDWMPYAIVSKRWSKSQGKENLALDPTQYSIAKALVDATDYDSKDLAMGLSFKLNMQAVLKLQIDFIKPDASSSRPTETQRLTTLNVDFVF